MRCYLVAEQPVDLSAVRAALADLRVEVVEPAHAFDAPLRPGSRWLPEVDFLCALFPAGAGWETPASVLLEIGQAVGAGMPVLLVAEPPRRLDPALFSIPVARIPLTSTVALTGQFGMFLQSMGKRTIDVSPAGTVDAAELDAIRQELASLRQTERTGGDESVQVLARRLEQAALRLLRAAGAEAEEAHRPDEGGDIAAWVPGTERFIPGPLVVDVKIVRGAQIDRNVLNQLQLYALTRDAPWCLLLYYSWDRNSTVRLPPGRDWPTVMVIDIEDLTDAVRRQSLAQILNNERNDLVHGRSQN